MDNKNSNYNLLLSNSTTNRNNAHSVNKNMNNQSYSNFKQNYNINLNHTNNKMLGSSTDLFRIKKSKTKNIPEIGYIITASNNSKKVFLSPRN